MIQYIYFAIATFPLSTSLFIFLFTSSQSLYGLSASQEGYYNFVRKVEKERNVNERRWANCYNHDCEQIFYFFFPFLILFSFYLISTFLFPLVLVIFNFNKKHFLNRWMNTITVLFISVSFSSFHISQGSASAHCGQKMRSTHVYDWVSFGYSDKDIHI